MSGWDDTAVENLRAALERLAAPGYSTCGRCRRPWKFVEGHMTPYAPGRSCFPLCERCWADLETPEARWPYYLDLLRSWRRDGGVVDAEQMRGAVWAEAKSVRFYRSSSCPPSRVYCLRVEDLPADAVPLGRTPTSHEVALLAHAPDTSYVVVAPR